MYEYMYIPYAFMLGLHTLYLVALNCMGMYKEHSTL